MLQDVMEDGGVDRGAGLQAVWVFSRGLYRVRREAMMLG